MQEASVGRRPLAPRLGYSSLLITLLGFTWTPAAPAATMKRYYAHEAVEDRYGVIAPWYQGQNGQCDLRVRIAAETLKRYPWTDPSRAAAAAPEYVFNGWWNIAPDGIITIPPLEDWGNGDLGQRAAYVLSGLVDYYRYSGDPAAIAHLTAVANTLLAHCQTDANHPWPNFLISVPTRGKPYGRCDPHGMIQLDIVAEVGIGLVRGAQLTGNTLWPNAAKRWANLLAEHQDRRPGHPPWNRYANPEDVGWEDHQTGGLVFILSFLDELIRLGYTGKDHNLVKAREAGRAYLRDYLLPRWTANDVWGRNYWDWNDPVQAENVTEFAARYFMENPEDFPNWRNDVRNILSLFLNRTSVAPESGGDVYSGAWAYPESSSCCGRSLCYGPMELATVYAQYGVLADSEWGREMARRQQLLATYDVHETGVVEDNIDGGTIVAGGWFKIAHPMALKHVLGTMAWLPETLGANRENHLMQTSAVVTSVVYGDGHIRYSTFQASPPSVDVLRLAFRPTAVTADGKPLPLRSDLKANGYQVKDLAGGDFLVSIRHDGLRNIVVAGNDPQQWSDDGRFAYTGDWSIAQNPQDLGGQVHVASTAGATMSYSFIGNQVRLIGRVDSTGGLADVYLDDVKQLVGLNCWNPAPRCQQVLYYKNGLSNGEHRLKIVVRGAKNPLSQGMNVYVDAVQWSAATGTSGFGEGGGPRQAQRWIFGYSGRTDYVDAQGHSWQPGTEFIIRTGAGADSVAASWWTERRYIAIANTPDPELYRYGVHGQDFTVYFTVGPGQYHVRLKFAETRRVDPRLRAVTLHLNGREVVSQMDVAATAGGFHRAVDLVFNGVRPEHGVIALRFTGNPGGEAMVQAIEVGPGPGGTGAMPISVSPSERQNLLVNPGFEAGALGALGALEAKQSGLGWNYLFLSPSQSYIWPESAYSIHPNWGLPVFHTGQEALRTHTDGNGHTVIYQDVQVTPNTPYRASVWVRAEDLHGRGFGTHPGDSAGLWIQEWDANGHLRVTHPKVAVTTAGDYRKLEVPFVTDKTTTKVRFILETVIASPYNEGHVTFDDCELVREERGE